MVTVLSSINRILDQGIYPILSITYVRPAFCQEWHKILSVAFLINIMIIRFGIKFMEVFRTVIWIK